MSNSMNRGVKYVSLGLLVVLLLALVVLLLALLYTSYNFSMSLPKATATMEAVVAKAESALAVAQTSEAKVGTQADAMKTPIARAETAVAAAETAAVAPIAVTLATPTTTPNPAPTGPMIPLDGGVAITYQAPDGSGGKVFYHVDSLRVYKEYAVTFDEEWASSTTVQLALVVITEHEEWQLFYPEAARPVTESIATGFSGWSEYTLAAEPERASGAGSGAVGEPGLVAANLFLSESPKQTIVTSTAFVDVDGDPTIDNLESALSRQFLDKGNIRKLLLVQTVAGEPKYTLVVIAPTNPSGGDQEKHWCESLCSWLGCMWICR
jgi:hypothetical protein